MIAERSHVLPLSCIHTHTPISQTAERRSVKCVLEIWSYAQRVELTTYILLIHPLIFTRGRVKTCEIWPRFSTAVAFEALWFRFE